MRHSPAVDVQPSKRFTKSAVHNISLRNEADVSAQLEQGSHSVGTDRSLGVRSRIIWFVPYDILQDISPCGRAVLMDHISKLQGATFWCCFRWRNL
jgi:hypothetical protein